MRYAIGIDIGGTNTSLGLVSSAGAVRKKITYKTSKLKNKFLTQLIEGISLLIEGVKKDVEGIGVGIPGTIDPKTGKISKLPNLKPLNGLDLVKVLKKKFRKKVLMLNDGSCAAIGEYKFGVGCKAKSLFVLTLGTGIGGGVIIDGKIYSGRGNAPEPGPMLLGNKEWEELASGRALEKLLKNKRLAYEEYAYRLGIGLSNVIKLYDPEIIVFTGRVVRSQDKFLKKAINVAKKNTFFPIGEIVVSNFPEEVGIIGAASLLF